MDITDLGYISAAIITIAIVCIIAVSILAFLFETGVLDLIVAMIVMTLVGAIVYGFTSFITGNIWIWQYSELIVCISVIHGAILLLILELDDAGWKI